LQYVSTAYIIIIHEKIGKRKEKVMLILFDAMIFLYGAYAIYSSVRMKQTGQLNTLFTGMATGQVRDVKGYIDYIYGRAIVMGAMAAVFGAVGFFNDYVRPVPSVMRALILLFLTVCVWFYISLSRGKRKFW